MNGRRLADIHRFYKLLDRLEQKIGGGRLLSQCNGRLGWPQRGVYFFREVGEIRRDSGTGPRIVRIGTHALTVSSRTTLWNRLSQHRGPSRSAGGNHRGSVFRLLVGTSLIGSGEHSCKTWNDRQASASAEVRAGELPMEQAVSRRIGAMSLLWLAVNDPPSRGSDRGIIERGSIALLSNSGKYPIDPPSVDWLGHSCSSPLVKSSGLWNQNHVKEQYDPAFLDKLDALVTAQVST
jgi:hypothetical protein